MKPELAFLVALGMLGIGVEVCLAECPANTVLFGNSCYYFSTNTTALIWKDARSECLSRGMHLAVVESKGEDLFLTCKATKDGIRLWLDGTDEYEEGTWIWSSTGKKITYFNWDKPDNEPDGCVVQNCLAIYKSHKGNYYSWYDAGCTKQKLGYVCELELETNVC